MFRSFSVVLLSFASLSRFDLASAQSTRLAQSIPLLRRSQPSRDIHGWGEWAQVNKEQLMGKYGDGQPQKRGTGTNLLANQNSDSSFFGSLAIGTPPVSYNVILDTGSSDLFVADTNCEVGCNGLPVFDPLNSSSFTTNDSPFHIQYGSGQASGTLGQDIIEMAGFSVSNQTFAVCNRLSPGLLSNPVSGLLGLGWRSISSSGALPFWQALAAGGAWDSPVMSFQLTRFTNDSSPQAVEPGGTFTMGFVNTSLFTGDIEYLDVIGKPSYWLLSMTAMTVQGNSISLPEGDDSLCAIDTGTTLVGGPPDIVSSMYAQIPGAQPAAGNLTGYYTYPCSTTVNVTLSFGGRTWPISPADFRLAQISLNTCLGAFFEMSTGTSAPAWIVGDTFLKNVYSVFRYDPPSVGFADLSNTATVMNGQSGPPPSPTIGSPTSVITVTSESGQNWASRVVNPPYFLSIAAILIFSGTL